MKKVLVLCQVMFVFGIFLILSGCNSAQKSANNQEFFKTSWYYNNKLMIRNDSSVSFAGFDSVKNVPTDLQEIPLQINDSSLIISRYQERGYYSDTRDFVITHTEKNTDTVLYDFKFINKKPKLILYFEPFPMILSSKEDIPVDETQNFTPVKFLILDYSIGDQIDRALLKTRGIYNYPNYTIEDCEYTDNKDVTFKIIGYNTIYSIERRRIEDFRVKDIVDVVSSKLGLQPEYRPMRQWVDGTDYEYEFYRWSGHGVQISLSRSKYVGKASYKTLVGQDDWTLSYDDLFQQAVLVETYRNGKPQSSIIN